MIDFPSNPVQGQDYTFGNRTWRWNGDAWARLVNQGQSVAVFTPTGTLVQQDVAALPGVLEPWHQVNYV